MRMKRLRLAHWASRVMPVLAPVLLLTACHDGDAAAPVARAVPSAADAPAARAATLQGYVLVTQERPESMARYLRLPRESYELCVIALQRQHKTVKPFPAVPADYVTMRTTYANDGRRDVVRQENYTFSVVPGGALEACEWHIAKTSNVTLIENGDMFVSGMDAEGKLSKSGPLETLNETVPAKSLARYTVARTSNGVPLKCNPGSEYKLCIVDPALALVTQGSSVVTAASRIENVPVFGTMIVEPVSLVVGKPLDPALFSMEIRK
jgi:hypothetical protein